MVELKSWHKECNTSEEAKKLLTETYSKTLKNGEKRDIKKYRGAFINPDNGKSVVSDTTNKEFIKRQTEKQKQKQADVKEGKQKIKDKLTVTREALKVSESARKQAQRGNKTVENRKQKKIEKVAKLQAEIKELDKVSPAVKEEKEEKTENKEQKEKTTKK